MPLAFDEKSNYFVISFKNFNGGLNTRDYDAIIRDNELSEINNLTYDKRGALKKRAGYKRINNSSLGTSSIISLGGYYKTGELPERIASIDDKLYSMKGSMSFEMIKDNLYDGATYCMHQFMNKLFITNGEDELQVYNGNNIVDAGYFIPDNNVTLAKNDSVDGGLEDKEYKYKVTFYYTDGESNECEDEVSITPTDGKSVNISNIPIGGLNVTQRRLYRTTGDGAVYKLLTTINNNTTTTYTDKIPDSGLGADIEIDNYPPPKCKYIVNHKGRLWFAGNKDNRTRLYYSKALHPESVPSDYYWEIGQDDGDIITGLAINLGVLVIFKRYSTWLIIGDSPTGVNVDMSLENANPTIGCASFNSIKHAGNDLLFLSATKDVYRLHRVVLAASETMDTEPISDKISETTKQINSKYLNKTHAVVYDHKYHLFVPDGSSEVNTKALVLDLRDTDTEDENKISWTTYSDMNFASSLLFYDDDGSYLYTGSNNTGYVYSMYVGNNDDGKPINAYAVTKWFDMENFMSEKVFRMLSITGRASEDYEFALRLILNTGKNIPSSVIYKFSGGGVVHPQAVLYDDLLFDKTLYDADGDYTNVVFDWTKSKLLNSKAYRVKIRIENINASSEFALYGMELRGYINYVRPIV